MQQVARFPFLDPIFFAFWWCCGIIEAEHMIRGGCYFMIIPVVRVKSLKLSSHPRLETFVINRYESKIKILQIIFSRTQQKKKVHDFSLIDHLVKHTQLRHKLFPKCIFYNGCLPVVLTMIFLPRFQSLRIFFMKL